MNTISVEPTPGRRRRRTHSPEFKAHVVEACAAPGVSIAAVALANGINANLARRWVFDAEAGRGRVLAKVDGGIVRGFVPVQLPPVETAPADIRIELRRGTTVINAERLAMQQARQKLAQLQRSSVTKPMKPGGPS